MQMIASYFFVSANVLAADGISNAPGTRTIWISFFSVPERKSPSYALCRSLSVMNALKRDTTIAKRFPDELRPPAKPRSSGSARSSEPSFLLSVFLVTQCLRAGFALTTLCLCAPCGKALDLLPLERRRPLLQKCRRTFLLIFGRATYAEQHGLKIEALGQSHLHTLIHRFHCILNGQRSVRNNLRRNRLGARNQIRRRSDLVHQPDAQRLLRGNHLARQHHLHG